VVPGATAEFDPHRRRWTDPYLRVRLARANGGSGLAWGSVTLDYFASLFEESPE